jgi:hypothetical protein
MAFYDLARKGTGWGLVGFGLLPDGTTYSAPSLTTGGNFMIIAAEGPSHSLKFYSSADSGATWNPEQAASTGTTYSAPSMTTNSAGVIISAAGPSGSLDFYWQLFGGSTWNPEQVAPPGSVG